MLVVCLILISIIALISLVLKLLHVNIISIITIISKIIEIHLSVSIKIVNNFKPVPIALSLRYLGRATDCWNFSSSLFQKLIVEFWELAFFVFKKFALILFDSGIRKEPFQKVDRLIRLDDLLCNRLVGILTNFFVLTRPIVLLLYAAFLLVNHIFEYVVSTPLELFVLNYSA